MTRLNRRASVWARLTKAGLAGEVADAIVKTQPLPDRLLRELMTPDAPLPLSSAEAEILQDAAEGLTAEESARKRHRSPETVKTQRQRVLTKLHARNMTRAVAIVAARAAAEREG